MTNYPQAPATEFDVPQQFSRGYGQPLTDVRGRGYYLSVGALATGLFALGLTVFFGFGGLSILPGMISVYLGIMAIKGAKKPHPTPFSAKATQNGIWGIVCGALAVVLTLGGVILLAVFSDESLLTHLQ